MTNFNQQSFFLDSQGEFLACTTVVPAKINAAVLMLLPFAEERKGVLPFFINLARELAKCEIASMIFDWRGSGDSSGDFETTDPADYHIDFRNALSHLQTFCGEVPITLLGIRLSATLVATLSDLPVAKRILISPTDGDEFLRQLLQRRMVNDMVAYGSAIESRSSLLQKLSNGEAIDLDGYLFSSAFFKWAQALAINAPDSSTSTKQWLLVPGGHSLKTFKAISEHLTNRETIELRFPPFWNTVGYVDLHELRDHLITWICAPHEYLASTPADDNANSSQPGDSASRDAAQGDLRDRTSKESRILTRISQMELLTTVVQGAVADEPQCIRSVLEKPDCPPRAAVLFLPGWSGDRSGPHRIFVQMARELTRQGFVCLRPDFRGRGCSDGAHAGTTIASMAGDAEYALDELRRRIPENTPIYVAAICSGCKVAITLAADHPEINRMLLLSAESMGSLRSAKTDANKTKKALKTYLKKLTRPETWKKILTGKVQTGMVTKALVQHETRSDAEADAEDATLRAFKKFSNPLHFVFGGSDPDAPGSMAAYQRYCEANNIPCSTYLVAHAGHSYYSAKWSAEVMSTALDFLTAEDKCTNI